MQRKNSALKMGAQMSILGLALFTGLPTLRADDAANVPATPTSDPTATAVDSANTSQRGGDRGGGEMLSRLVDRVATAVKSLGLSDDQQKQMDAVVAQARQDAASDEASFPTMDPDDRRAAVRDFMQKYRGQVMGILSDDQKAQLREKMGGPDNGAGNSAGGGKKIQQFFAAINSLDLTDEQKKQIADLRREMRAKVVALAKDKADGKDVTQEGQDLRQEIREKLSTILTPDQLQQLKDKMQEQATEPGNAGGGNAAGGNGAAGNGAGAAPANAPDPAPIGPANNPAPSTQPGN